MEGGRLLSPLREELVITERTILDEVVAALQRAEAGAEEIATLKESLLQLDRLFMLVVVGEFNAGKSALINALLGQALLEQGVTPTTTRLHVISYGEKVGREPIDAVHEKISAPLEILRDLAIVDTPGTNALDRRHEALTSDFVPRSDLVLFVTSADRPFSESERAFLERTRQWGKKIIVVVNKIDILRGEDEVAEIERYIAEHSKRLLGIEPAIFPVSAARAATGRAEGDDHLLETSRLPELEQYLRTTLDEAERLRLKLLNPLGVATRLLDTNLERVATRLDLLDDDRKTLADIEAQLATWSRDVAREFSFRLSDIDTVLFAMERRGIDFFDDTLRLARIRQLLRKDQLRSDFERTVVADMPEQIESRVDAIIDWLVDSDLNQWQSVVQHVGRRSSEHSRRIVGEVGSRFESNRSSLLETVGKAARQGLEHYDRAREARRMADDVQKAVASAALMEVGAVGLGATVGLIAGSTTADATGLIAAGLLAALGLFILPHRRRRAKEELRATIATMRERISIATKEQFDHEAEASRRRILETIAPYSRFVRTETARLASLRDETSALKSRVSRLIADIESECP
jgi:small GTP-binding protein